MSVLGIYVLAILGCWIPACLLALLFRNELTDITKGQAVLYLLASLTPFFNVMVALFSSIALFMGISCLAGQWLNTMAPDFVAWWNEPVKEEKAND